MIGVTVCSPLYQQDAPDRNDRGSSVEFRLGLRGSMVNRTYGLHKKLPVYIKHFY